jgi:hypothetical protein
MRSLSARSAPRRRAAHASHASHAVAAAARTRSIRAGHASIRAGHGLVAFPRLRGALGKTGAVTALIGVGARARVRPPNLRLVVAACDGYDRARNESERQHPHAWCHSLSVSLRGLRLVHGNGQSLTQPRLRGEATIRASVPAGTAPNAAGAPDAGAVVIEHRRPIGIGGAQLDACVASEAFDSLKPERSHFGVLRNARVHAR